MKQLSLAVIALLTSCTYAPTPPRKPPAPRPPVLTEVARFEGDVMTGVAVSQRGRVFVSFPNWHAGHRVHVAEVDPLTGEHRPYPDEAWNSWTTDQPVRSGMGPDQFICVQALRVDDHDRLWVLDAAAPGMMGIAPNARPKLVRFDLESNREDRSFFFDSVAAPPGAYLNDVRFDTDADRAYITDSSLGGLVVLDTATGVYRRTLTGHPSTMADPSIVLMCDGKELRFAVGPNAGKVPQVHSNGLALDTKHGYLYWQPMTSRTLYRIPTSLIGDLDATDEQIASGVQTVGLNVATDGMEIDSRGNLYFSDFEHNAVVVRTTGGSVKTLVADPRLAWPTSFAVGPGGTMYVTASQIQRTAWFRADGSMPTTPYVLFKLNQYGR
ncbi:MAG: SMP-30/gluconolactonase/LRE family protein [Phycisphaerae bacterium]|nr:SMP-30/gluconolactonase/LRE family protein [Phycisphaerae bacterium]